MKAFVTGILSGFCLVVAAGYIFIVSGGMPVATKSAPLPLEQWAAEKSIEVATREAAGMKSPIEPTEDNLIGGAKLFLKNCAVCHGLPGHAPGAIASGMFPGPPALFDPKQSAAGFPVGGIYWVIKNGIRLTGMPGFERSLRDAELWQLALLLKKSNELPPSVAETFKPEGKKF